MGNMFLKILGVGGSVIILILGIVLTTLGQDDSPIMMGFGVLLIILGAVAFLMTLGFFFFPAVLGLICLQTKRGSGVGAAAAPAGAAGHIPGGSSEDEYLRRGEKRQVLRRAGFSTVKVHTVVKGETFGVHEDLMTRLTKEVGVCRTNQQECDYIILFCPISSRVGSDVDAAMRDMTGDKKIILVLMHHTRDLDYSCEGMRWSDTFNNVVLDVHVLFHETLQGLPVCPRNNMSVFQIRDALVK